MGVNIIWRRIRYLLRRSRADEELAEEMQLHMDLRAAKLREHGANERESALAAGRRFGNPGAIRESSSDSWGWQWLAEAWLDAKLSVRLLARAPGFAAVVVLTLGLGIGSATAIFNVVNGVLLESLPYREPERLVSVQEKLGDLEAGFSPPDYLRLVGRKDLFAEIGAYRNLELDLSGSVTAERVTGARLTASLFKRSVLRQFWGAPLRTRTTSKGATVRC